MKLVELRKSRERENEKRMKEKIGKWEGMKDEKRERKRKKREMNMK